MTCNICVGLTWILWRDGPPPLESITPRGGAGWHVGAGNIHPLEHTTPLPKPAHHRRRTPNLGFSCVIPSLLYLSTLTLPIMAISSFSHYNTNYIQGRLTEVQPGHGYRLIGDQYSTTGSPSQDLTTEASVKLASTETY